MISDIGFQNTIALVALIISLIALLIASFQLFQALFGTADGYKRCSKPFIGPWEGLRHRRFLLSELRYQVRYITPHILLVTPSTKQWLESRSHKQASRNGSDADQVCILHMDLIRETETSKLSRQYGTSWWNRDYFSWKGWLSRRHHPWDRKNKLRILRSTISDPRTPSGGQNHEDYHHSPLRSDTLPLVNTHGLLMPRSSGADKPRHDDEMRVTWATLLKEISLVYSSYSKHPFAASNMSKASTLPPTLRTPTEELSRGTRLDDNVEKTDAAITFRQWSWDLMPPEVLQPLATITVRHLIVLAVRLGMQWRVLKLNSGMYAEGHGFSLVGTKSDRLGFIFKLVATGFRDKPWRLVPSQAADKLICGILPGCPILVKRDYDLVDDARKCLLDLLRVTEPGHIFTHIGVPWRARERLRKDLETYNSFASIHNEIVPLLCAFLPLVENPTVVRHYAHCWRTGQHSVLHSWEGRFGLLYCLRKEVTTEVEVSHEPLQLKILEYFEELFQRFPEDFLSLPHGRVMVKESGHPSNPQRRVELVALCRQIHDWTSTLFRYEGFVCEEEPGRTYYQTLVAGHFEMAIYAQATNLEHRKDLHGCPFEGAVVPDDLMPILNSVRPHKPRWVLTRILANTLKYVEVSKTGESAIAHYLRVRGFSGTDTIFRAIWWMLMLRGVAWDMSTIAHEWGEPIPSSFYDNHTTVWIA